MNSQKPRSINLLLLLCFFLILPSCNDEPVPTVEGAPAHIRAMYKSDPATSVVIAWNRFHHDKNQDIIYWDTVDHGDDINLYRYSQSPDHYSNYKDIESAFVELKGLEPESNVYFVIVNEKGQSTRHWVQTLPDNRDAKLSFISGGDSRNNRIPRTNANKLVSKIKPHAVLFGGDMTDNGSGAEWFRWFDDWELTTDSTGRLTPILAARGNHEDSNTVLEKLFWLPKNNYYALSFADGLIRFYSLNSEISTGGNQLEWLEKDLANNQDIVWKFAQYHKPMRPHVKSKSEGSSEYKFWSSVFYDNGMDLVMESDSHSVKSTWPLRPFTGDGSDEGFIRDDENGTVYVGEGCWGAPLRNSDDTKAWTRDSGSFNQFKLIHVSAQKIELRTIKVDNADEVGENTLENRFDFPLNLDVWNPNNGDVITIQ